MGVVETGSEPTLAEAERAAKVVAGQGAGRVLLFGSVARGEAHPHSDIDLMVIFDDLDYTRRQDLTMELEHLAHAEVGCSVDVHLTDRPEWKMRTEQVATSFENRVKDQARLLVDKEPGDVDWGKKMVMPANDYEEAVERLRQVANALEGIQESFVPTFAQRRMDEDGQEMEAYASYEARLARGCAAGHLTVETAVKSLIHLSGALEAQPWGHYLDKLLPQLPERHRSEITTRLASVGVENLQKWQQQARYERFVPATPEVFTSITDAACRVARYSADQFPPGLDMATRVRKNASDIEEAMARFDLYTGRDLPWDNSEGRAL